MSTHSALTHDPNLDLPGTREPETSGPMGLDQINARLQQVAQEPTRNSPVVRSHPEGALVDALHE